MIFDALGLHFDDFGHPGRPCRAQMDLTGPQTRPGEKKTIKKELFPPPPGHYFETFSVQNEKKYISGVIFRAPVVSCVGRQVFVSICVAPGHPKLSKYS